MNKLSVKDFSLSHTIECGQFFMYEKIEEFYYVIDSTNVFRVKQIDDELFYEGIDDKRLIEFFSLDINLNELTRDFRSDEHLLLALEKYWGLRLIRQDLWQCIIGFVCSSAANIPKIKTNLKLISEFFGEKIEFDGKAFYIFPKPGFINDIEKIKAAKTGYRAKYIYEINRLVKENPKLLEEIKKANYENAKEMLMKFPGVGSKVADCICLFSLNHTEAFPIDTWVKQVIEKYYLKRKAKNTREIGEFIKDYFKENKGIKQQYLFHYIRNL